MQETDFKDIYKEHFNKIKFFAQYYLGNEHEAENVAQETFIILWKNLEKVKGGGNGEVIPYITVIARNLCINILRRRKNITSYNLYKKYDEDSISLDALRDFSAINVYIKEINHLLEEALTLMPSKIERTFRHCKLEGMKYEEVALAENISVKTVEYRMTQALKVLRRHFKDYLGVIVFIISMLWMRV